MKKLSISVCVLLLSISNNIFGQTQIDSLGTVNSTILKEKKLKFGMGFGLNFVGGTSINLSPNLTYKLNDQMALGAGILFNYNAVKDLQKTTTIGANALYFYNPVQKLVTTAEFALMNVNRNNLVLNKKDQFWDKALFIGAGYQITPKIAVGGKYNLLYNKEKSVYSSPFVPFVNIVF